MVMDNQSWYLDLNYEQWASLPVDGQRPAARYKVNLPRKLNSLDFQLSFSCFKSFFCFHFIEKSCKFVNVDCYLQYF